MESQGEIWKSHPDIEGIEVSSFGRVRSVKGYCYKSNPGNSGYLLVQFYMNGKHVNKNVHRLVAETFIPNPNNLPEVNHKDGDRVNNNVSNLEWCSHSYNIQYREKYGEALGVPVFAVNLSNPEVSWFPSQIEASRSLGLFQPNINAVIKEKYKQTGGFWFVNDDDNAVDLTKQKLNEIGKTELTAADADSVDFVSKIIYE